MNNVSLPKVTHFAFSFFSFHEILSYDVAVFQWITSYDHMCINTFAGICNVTDDVRNNNVNFH